MYMLFGEQPGHHIVTLRNAKVSLRHYYPEKKLINKELHAKSD